jgi:hypothetical protein
VTDDQVLQLARGSGVTVYAINLRSLDSDAMLRTLVNPGLPAFFLAAVTRETGTVLAMLADAGAPIPQAEIVPATGQESLLLDFRRHLLGERALAAATAAAYVAYARRFLAGFAGEGLAGLTAADVTRAVTAEAQTVSASSAQYFVAALRAFLRFCFLEGLLHADLAGAALAVTGRRRHGGWFAGPGGLGREPQIGEHHEREDQQHDRAEREADHEPLARPVRPPVARDDVLEPAHDRAL